MSLQGNAITAPRREVHGLMFVGCFVKDSTRRTRGIKMKYVSTLFKFSYLFFNDMKLKICSTIVTVEVLCRICEPLTIICLPRDAANIGNKIIQLTCFLLGLTE